MTLDLDNLARLVAGWTGTFVVRRGELWFVDGLPGSTLHDAHCLADVDDGAKHVAQMLNALPALLADHARLTAEVARLRGLVERTAEFLDDADMYIAAAGLREEAAGE